MYRADLTISSLLARYNRSREMNKIRHHPCYIYITSLISLYSALLEFPSKHCTLQSASRFTTFQYQLVKYLRRISWTQNCRKSQILRLPKKSRLKYELHAKNAEYSFIVEPHLFKTANSSKREIRLYNFLWKTIASQVSFRGNLSVFPLRFPFPSNLINTVVHSPQTFSKNLYLSDSQKPRGV